jgi:phosphocarrier protein HPr
MQQRQITIVNKLGLHARAAAKLVNTAGAYAAEVLISKNGQQVNGKSIMGVMMLAASCGSQVELQVDGEDEQQAMDALVSLIEDRFGEDE